MTQPECTCDEGRATVCHQLGTEPHYVGCPRWGSPITGGYVGYGVRPALPDNTHWYDQGGVVPPALARKVLHPDECVLTRHPMVCVRPDHPTAASNCATTEETA